MARKVEDHHFITKLQAVPYQMTIQPRVIKVAVQQESRPLLALQ